MSAPSDVQRLAALLESLFEGSPAPKRLRQIRPLAKMDRGQPVAEAADGSGFTARRLLIWHQAIEQAGLFSWLGKKAEPGLERLDRARAGIAQMLVGQLAEEHFELASTELLGAKGYRIEDERQGRSDTDYRLLDPAGRPLLRLNIKFHGTLFKQAQEYVGLSPSDCFPLATYKIYGALQRQQEERLPFVFLVISVPDFPRDLVQRAIADDWAWLAAMTGRAEEEAIARKLSRESWVDPLRARIGSTGFRAISARRAYALLRELLFDRVHALRLRGFNQLFRGAEINMHLSLAGEMIGYQDFLQVLTDHGPVDLALRLDRGEI